MGGRLCAVLVEVRRRVLVLGESRAACSGGWRESQGWGGVWVGVRVVGRWSGRAVRSGECVARRQRWRGLLGGARSPSGVRRLCWRSQRGRRRAPAFLRFDVDEVQARVHAPPAINNGRILL
eukprot:COSAG02_NODE_2456_length_8812_cov_2.849535_8_plen_122_part_00